MAIVGLLIAAYSTLWKEKTGGSSVQAAEEVKETEMKEKGAEIEKTKGKKKKKKKKKEKKKKEKENKSKKNTNKNENKNKRCHERRRQDHEGPWSRGERGASAAWRE